MKERVFVIAFTDSVHSLVHQKAPKSVIEFYEKVTFIIHKYFICYTVT